MAKDRLHWNSKVSKLRRELDEGKATYDDIIWVFNQVDGFDVGNLKDWQKDNPNNYQIQKAIEIIESDSYLYE